jgi:G3E family GTPase
LGQFSAASVVRTVNADLPLDILSTQPSIHATPHAAASWRGHAASLHDPSRTFRSVTLPMRDVVDIASLTRALLALTPGLLRAKGFVRSRDDPDGRCLVELSGQHVSVRRWQPNGTAQLPNSGMVFIGFADLPDAASLTGLLSLGSRKISV